MLVISLISAAFCAAAAVFTSVSAPKRKYTNVERLQAAGVI